MLANPTGNFQSLITRLQTDKRYEQSLKKGEQNYQIRQFKVNSLTPFKITEMYYQITTKFYSKKTPGDKEPWFENELRVFIWLLIGYSYVQDLNVSKMGNQDWKIFSTIFNDRNPDIFQFQALSILKKENKCAKWSQEQTSLLESIINDKRIKNRWNQIAKDLFIISNKQYFRTAKQCRQHWISHLDPSPLRTGWTIQEDYQLISLILELGKKWSKISKNFDGKRTQHMVKNRFKSLMHFQKKKRTLDGSQLCETRLIQLLMEDVRSNFEKRLDLNLLFADVESKSRGNQVVVTQIQSAGKQNTQKSKYCDKGQKSIKQDCEENDQDPLDDHQFNIWCQSPKQQRQNIPFFLANSNDKYFPFQEYIRREL